MGKPRNQNAVVVRMRKAGVHQASRKSLRRTAKQSLKKQIYAEFSPQSSQKLKRS